MTAASGYLLGLASALLIFGLWRLAERIRSWLGDHDVYIHPSEED